MEINIRNFIRVGFFTLLFFLSGFLGVPSEVDRKDKEGFTRSDLKYIIAQVKNEQLEDEYLEKIFFNQNLKRYSYLVNMNVVNRVPDNMYKKFTSPYSVFLAKKFSKKWRTLLKRASRKFKVDQEVIVSILLIETNFGKILGRKPILSVFSSIIIENHPKYKESLFADISKKYPDIDREYFDKRIEAKADWALEELKALLILGQNSKINPLNIKGSYAGAFGIPQFLPSSYMKWGYDSDKNGFVNLFLFPDAIYSTANYLNSHGWKPNLKLKDKRKVIFNYNRSNDYVSAVLKLARLLKKQT